MIYCQESDNILEWRTLNDISGQYIHEYLFRIVCTKYPKIVGAELLARRAESRWQNMLL